MFLLSSLRTVSFLDIVAQSLDHGIVNFSAAVVFDLDSSKILIKSFSSKLIPIQLKYIYLTKLRYICSGSAVHRGFAA